MSNADTTVRTYPETVQVQSDGLTWYFSIIQRGNVAELDHTPVEFAHVEIEGRDFEPVRNVLFTVPDSVRECMQEHGYTVIG